MKHVGQATRRGTSRLIKDRYTPGLGARTSAVAGQTQATGESAGTMTRRWTPLVKRVRVIRTSVFSAAVDHRRCDAVNNRLSGRPSRRQGLGVLAVLGLCAGLLADGATAKHRKQKKNVTRNAFGCVDVGRFCENGGPCCSGVCSGKSGKKTCQNHDAATCQNRVSETDCGGAVNGTCLTSTGAQGTCNATSHAALLRSNAREPLFNQINLMYCAWYDDDPR